METAQQSLRLTYQEYEKFEQASEARHEYEVGRVYAMAGGTVNHNLITTNTQVALRGQMKRGGCRTFSENMRVEALWELSYRYPDVVVACHPFDLRGENLLIRQPRLIVEVLSKSTEKEDRGVKWQRYRKISSLIYYILIDQYKVTVELFSRIEQTEEWISTLYDSLDDVFVLPRLNAELRLTAIYEDIELVGEEE